MHALLRPAVAVLALGTLAVCAFGLRFACDPVSPREVMEVVRRAGELQQLERAMFRRAESRRQVAQGVIARRCSLGEAIARFRELGRESPKYAAVLSQLSKKQVREWPTEEENDYSYLLGIIQYLLRDRPEEAAAVLRRLEEDYRQLRAGRPAPSTGSAGRTVRAGGAKEELRTVPGSDVCEAERMAPRTARANKVAEREN